MKRKADYEAFRDRMYALEKYNGPFTYTYLMDQNIDNENCVDAGLTEDDGDDYWDLMLTNAHLSVAMRMIDLGMDPKEHGVPY